jgi:hypothetical protein
MDFLIRSDTTNRDSLSALYKLSFAFSSPIRSRMELLAQRIELSDLSSYNLSPSLPKLAFERIVPAPPGQSQKSFSPFPNIDIGPMPSGSVSNSLGERDVRVRFMCRNQQLFDIVSDQRFTSDDGTPCLLRDYIQIKWSEISDMPETELLDFVNFVKSFMGSIIIFVVHMCMIFSLIGFCCCCTLQLVSPTQARIIDSCSSPPDPYRIGRSRTPTTTFAQLSRASTSRRQLLVIQTIAVHVVHVMTMHLAMGIDIMPRIRH